MQRRGQDSHVSKLLSFGANLSPIKERRFASLQKVSGEKNKIWKEELNCARLNSALRHKNQ
ncbi:MAG: hypothetical protein AYK19_07520 [Theionarchaea archaeon DG-70-1]|nr:MAG: hypothetical protein AYK19_07520 [Theionarchaea archaeon DG-70-1]